MDLKLVYFFYGLAFFSMGIVIWVRIRSLMDMKLARAFVWLIAFGMVEAAHDWVEMFVVMEHTGSSILVTASAMHMLSFAILLQFGIQVIGIKKNLSIIIRLIPIVLFTIWLLSYRENLMFAETWSRHLLGFSGPFLTAYALISKRKDIVESPNILRNLFFAGVVFAFYGLLTAVSHKGNFFPDPILSDVWFTSLVGLPVQIFRALSAIAISYFIVKSLDVFDVMEKRILAAEVKEMTGSLEESEEKYRTLFELAGDALLTVVPPQGEILDANDIALQMLGYSKEELAKLSGWDIVAPEVVEEIKREWQTQVEDKGHFLLETIWVRKDGSRFPVEVSGKPLELRGKVLFQLIGRDITERKRTEEALKQSQKNYEDLVNTIKGIVWEADAQTFQFSFVSEQAERLLGYPIKDWLTEPTFWKDHLHPDDREWVVDFCTTKTKEKRPHEFEYRMIAANGHPVWLRDIVTVVVENDQPVKLRGVMVDITEKKRAEEKLVKFSNVIDQAEDIVLITDSNGNIEYVNPAFEKITGYSKEDVLGKTPRILKSGEMSQEYYNQVWSTILSGKTIHAEVINRKKSGELFIYDQTISPLKDAQGNITNFISTGKDVTERVEARKKLEEALRRAKQADKVKTLFLANMSHEIRTPLNSILGFTDLIEQSVSHLIDPEVKSFFKTIRNSGERLIHTVHEILDISQIEAGTFDLEPEQLNLTELIDQVVRELTPIAKGKGIDISFASTVSDVMIKADEYCITQALSNLIDNAIKYTEEGWVGVSLKRKDQKLTLEIQDTGVGMSGEYLEHLFEIFSQESTGYTKKFQGVGLGLVLTKRYLDMNGVGIDVKSEKGVGTTFTLTFRSFKQYRRHLKKKSKMEPPVKLSEATSKKPMVLMVEDDPNSQRLMEFFLKRNYNTCFAVSVAEAKQQLKKHSVDVILLDLSLIGDEDGLDLTRHLRKTENWQDIPIIAVTAHAFVSDRENVFAAGCNDYLVKPIKKQELLEKISQFV